MFIDFSKNPSLLRGVLSAENSPSGTSLCRYPAGIGYQNEYMARCTAGCRVAFVTNSPFFRLPLLLTSPLFNCYHGSADLLIDSTELLNFSVPDEEPSQGGQELGIEHTFAASGEHRVELFLPNQRETLLGQLEIENGSYILPCSYSGKALLFLGDSITQGFFSDPGRSWAALIARKQGCDFRNWGIGGAPMPGSLGEEALNVPWGTVFVSYGVNDFFARRPVAEVAEEEEKLLKALSSRQEGSIVLLTPIPCLSALHTGQGEILESYRKAIAGCAAKFSRVKVIDGNTLLPGEQEFFGDGAHPLNSGMELIASRIAAQL